MKKKVFIMISCIFVIAGILYINQRIHKPLELDLNIQRALDYMKFTNCYILKLGNVNNKQKKEIYFEVTEEVLEERIDEVLGENAYRQIINDRDIIREGDLAVTDYTIYNKGVKVESIIDAPIRVGSGNYDRNIEKAIMGLQVGKTYNVDWEIPPNLGKEELLDADVKLEVFVKSIYHIMVPSIEEYALQQGYSNVTDYKAFVKAELKEEKEREMFAYEAEKIIDSMIDNSKFDIDDNVIADNAVSYYYQHKDMADKYNLSIEEYIYDILQYKGDVYELCYEESLRDVQRYLVMGRYAKEQEITLSNKDVENYYKEHQIDIRTLTEEQVSYIKYQIIENKVLKNIENQYLSQRSDFYD